MLRRERKNRCDLREWALLYVIKDSGPMPKKMHKVIGTTPKQKLDKVLWDTS